MTVIPPARFVEVGSKASLILVAIALFATENLVHYPVALMSLLGVARLISQPKRSLPGAARVLLVMFALVWIPMLVASAGAIDVNRAVETSMLYLHFLPAAYFVLEACRDRTVLRLVTAGTVVLVFFAALDAFAQLICGVDVFGYPHDDGMLKGVFHPKQRLGLFLAVFAPLYVDAVVRWCRHRPQVWLVLVPIVIVILMSLKRSAWAMLLVAMAGYLALYVQQRGFGRSRIRLMPIAVVLIIAAATVVVNPTLKARLQSTAGVFSTKPAVVEEATAFRVSLWRTGLHMFADNWPTGIGPRGYRHAYARYAGPDDFWMQRNHVGQTHPHLLILEVAIETGIVGLVGLCAFYGLLLRELLRGRSDDPLPVWLLCAAVAWFPLNAHLAFYGSYWSTLVWLLLPIGLAAAAGARDHRPEAA